MLSRPSLPTNRARHGVNKSLPVFAESQRESTVSAKDVLLFWPHSCQNLIKMIWFV